MLVTLNNGHVRHIDAVAGAVHLIMARESGPHSLEDRACGRALIRRGAAHRTGEKHLPPAGGRNRASDFGWGLAGDAKTPPEICSRPDALSVCASSACALANFDLPAR